MHSAEEDRDFLGSLTAAAVLAVDSQNDVLF